MRGEKNGCKEKQKDYRIEHFSSKLKVAYSPALLNFISITLPIDSKLLILLISNKSTPVLSKEKIKNWWMNHSTSFVLLCIGMLVLLIAWRSSPRFDGWLFAASVLGLASLIGLSDYLLSRQSTERYEHTSTVLKNLVEIAVIVAGAIFTYNSAWFDDFFRMRTVNIRGTLELQGITDRFVLYEPVRLKFTFGGYEQGLPEFPVVLEAKEGVLAGAIELDKSYQFANVESLDTMYRFSALDRINNKPVRDTLCSLDSVQIYKNILSINPRLIKIHDPNLVARCR